MISRRKLIQLGAAATAFSTAFGSPIGSASQPSTPVAERESTTLAPGHNSSIIVKWTYDTGVMYGTPPTVYNGVAYGSVENAFVFAVNSETGAEVWRAAVDATTTEPVIANGLVYTCALSGSLIALDAAAGAERWRFDTGSEPFRPAVSDSTIYVGSNNGPFYALDAASGAEKWRFNAMQIDYNNRANAQVENNTVFVTAGSPVLFALDSETGRENWSFRVEGYATYTPVLSNGVVYFAGSDNIYAVDQQTGSQLWTFVTGSHPGTSLVLDNGLLYSGTSDGSLYALAAATGEVVWQHFPGGYGANILGVDSTSLVFDVITGGGAHPYYTLHSVNKVTGNEQWRSADTGNVLMPAVAGDGTVIVGERHSKLPDSDFSLYALDTATGAEIWRMTKPGGFRFASTFADGNLYTISQVGTVYCLGNPAPAILIEDAVVRAAPSVSGIERGTVSRGTELDAVGAPDSQTNAAWVEVTINGLSGWIPISAIDPATLPPQGDVEYIYQP